MAEAEQKTEDSSYFFKMEGRSPHRNIDDNLSKPGDTLKKSNGDIAVDIGDHYLVRRSDNVWRKKTSE